MYLAATIMSMSHLRREMMMRDREHYESFDSDLKPDFRVLRTSERTGIRQTRLGFPVPYDSTEYAYLASSSCST